MRALTGIVVADAFGSCLIKSLARHIAPLGTDRSPMTPILPKISYSNYIEGSSSAAWILLRTMAQNHEALHSGHAAATLEGLSCQAAENNNTVSSLRGKEITGLDIFRKTSDGISPDRAQALMRAMNEDSPDGGCDYSYGDKKTQLLRFWQAERPKAPIVIFIHGGSWRSGTYLDSVGSAKVVHLLAQGYAFATVDYTLVPDITVEGQVQEVADAVGYLARSAPVLDIDLNKMVLMGHSSGAHVVTLLGTNTSYLDQAEVRISSIRGIISIDGSNYNAMAEFFDSPGPVARSLELAVGRDLGRLRAMSPAYRACGTNARSFLLLHAQRHGDVRQAVEFAAVLEAADTPVALHVFEGMGFEGHMQILLRLGQPDYPATDVMDKWLRDCLAD